MFCLHNPTADALTPDAHTHPTKLLTLTYLLVNGTVARFSSRPICLVQRVILRRMYVLTDDTGSDLIWMPPARDKVKNRWSLDAGMVDEYEREVATGQRDESNGIMAFVSHNILHLASILMISFADRHIFCRCSCLFPAKLQYAVTQTQ